MESRLIDICLGKRIRYGDGDTAWESAVLKAPLAGPQRVGRIGFEADEQANTRHHGGVDKALLCVPLAQYHEIERVFGKRLGSGSLGENLLVDSPEECGVCLGDRWRVIRATGAEGPLFEISHPRQPCWKPGRANGLPGLAKWMPETGATGWYLRVIKEGELQAGDCLRLEARPLPEWSVLRCWKIYQGRIHDPGPCEELRKHSVLAEVWQR